MNKVNFHLTLQPPVVLNQYRKCPPSRRDPHRSSSHDGSVTEDLETGITHRYEVRFGVTVGNLDWLKHKQKTNRKRAYTGLRHLIKV